MIDTAFTDQSLDGLCYIVGVGSIKLHAPRRLTWSEVGELERLVATVDQRSGIDHFADVKAGAKSAAYRPKRVVGNSRHRGQYHRRPHRHRADTHRCKLPRFRHLDVSIDCAAVDAVHRSATIITFFDGWTVRLRYEALCDSDCRI